MASDTYASIPWMSDTTAMMDVTATMLPSTIMKERSLFAQIELSASLIGIEDGVMCQPLDESR